VPPVDDAIRQAVRALPPAVARAALELEDPAAAGRLHPHDVQRTMRALEVVRATGRPLADWQVAATAGLAACASLHAEVIDPPRTELVRRADARADAMLAAGAVEEVARLRARNLPQSLPAMRAIGVPPLLAHLEGLMPLAEAVTRWKLDTRQYIKRQSTWFRNQTPDWKRIAA
jgi:tRNA dimethylallyltransferase